MQIVEDTPTSCLFRRERRCPAARQPHAHLCLGLPGPLSPAEQDAASRGRSSFNHPCKSNCDPVLQGSCYTQICFLMHQLRYGTLEQKAQDRYKIPCSPAPQLGPFDGGEKAREHLVLTAACPGAVSTALHVARDSLILVSRPLTWHHSIGFMFAMPYAISDPMLEPMVFCTGKQVWRAKHALHMLVCHCRCITKYIAAAFQCYQKASHMAAHARGGSMVEDPMMSQHHGREMYMGAIGSIPARVSQLASQGGLSVHGNQCCQIWMVP